ncbi:hypothetical protein [Asticcacaulis sp. MM231]|uniref:DprA-like winged helix domain-containing protein n=1 Tax=Asticcacaulis sp. MM231 TaxID=3157666 RepID=UPI0032D586E7
MPAIDIAPFASDNRPANQEDDIARAARAMHQLISETPMHRDDLLRRQAAPAWLGLAALSELEISGVITACDGGYYSRS